MLKLQKTIEEHQIKIDALIKEFMEIRLQMSQINFDISDSKEILSDLDSQIKNLETISVFVYENGEIEIENSEITIPESWSDVFGNLTNDESIENLTMRQIEQLAKMIVLAKEFQTNNLNFEVSFESENLQHAFFNFQ